MADLVGQYESYRGSISILGGGTVVPGTLANPLNGGLIGVSMAMGTMTGTGTVVLDLVDSLGAVIFSGTQAESGTTFVGSAVPLNTSMSWVATPSGTQVNTLPFYFNAHYQK